MGHMLLHVHVRPHLPKQFYLAFIQHIKFLKAFLFASLAGLYQRYQILSVIPLLDHYYGMLTGNVKASRTIYASIREPYSPVTVHTGLAFTVPCTGF